LMVHSRSSRFSHQTRVLQVVSSPAKQQPPKPPMQLSHPMFKGSSRRLHILHSCHPASHLQTQSAGQMHPIRS
jgi:hypothetical protein